MTKKSSPSDTEFADHVAFEAFQRGLPEGRFRVIVNPTLAPPFIAQRLHAVPVAIALLGSGIACALGGYSLVGLVLIALGILLRRVLKRQAAGILLHLASRHEGTYYEATTQGVMEVQRA